MRHKEDDYDRANRDRINLKRKHPGAPHRVLFGTLYLQLPCERCGGLIWSNANNTRCVCDSCPPARSLRY